jgi:nucleotide-binding universal stress UspA family protein
MKRFKQILYYADAAADERSRSALERAADLTLRNRGRLTVLGVVQLPSDLHLLAPALPEADLWDLAMQDLRERLEQLVEPVRQKELRLDVEVRIGTPFIEIIRRVLAHGHDLVMMSAEGGRGGLKGLLFGSTSLHVMRKCPCPVWEIKPGPHRRFERILAAVNPDPCDEDHPGVSTQIMQLATSLARLEGSELRVVHAWDHPGEELLRGPARLPADEVDKIVRDTGATHQAWLNELLARHPLGGIRHDVHLLRGEAAEVIVELAAKNSIDLIILGTIGRTGIPGLFIGNTAETVLGQVDCSVLAVKPEGFETPVRLEHAKEGPS